MKKVILLGFLLAFFIVSAQAQTISETVSATYSTGDIQTDDGFISPDGASTCPGVLTFSPGNSAGQIPTGSIIVSVNVEYSMTSQSGAVMSDQRSELRCTSPGGTNEGEVFSPENQWSEGTWDYSRTGLSIANGIVMPFAGFLSFELHAGSNYWGAPIGCSADQMFVVNNTWMVTVTYLAPGSPNFPTNPSPVDMSQLVDVETDLTWDFGANTTSYDVYFGTDNPPTTKVVDDVSTGGGTGTYDPGTMTHATTYYWYVVDRNTQNEIAGPVWSFTTDCAPLSYPYFDNFDSYASGELPPCWLSQTTVENPNCYVSVANFWLAQSTPNAIEFLNGGNELDPNITLVLPKVAVNGYTVSDYFLSFYGKNGESWFAGAFFSPMEVGTITDPFDASTFTPLDSYVPDAYSWEYFEYYFGNYAGTDEYIAIRGDVNASWFNMFIDDLTLDLIPSCVKPLDVMADEILADQVTLSWSDLSTPTQWNVEYDTVGFTPGIGTGTVVPVFTNPAIITGLMDATDYDFYVQADCGGGDLSAWSQPLTLQTACLPYALPIYEDFGVVPPYPEVPQWPLCWSNIEVNGAQYGGMGLQEYNAHTGVAVWMDPSGDDASQLILTGPELDDDINTVRVSFWSRASIDGDSALIIGTMTDPADYNTFTPYDTLKDLTDVHQLYTIYFSNYAGTDTYIAWRHNSVEFPFTQAFVDDILFETIPSCVEPYRPYVDGLTQTSAMLNWIDPVETATNWQIEVGAPGFTPGTGGQIESYAPTATAGKMHSFDMTGLNPAVTYDAYIRTDCGAGEYSIWVGPMTFLTLFDAFGAIPVTEDFEAGMGITGNDPANPQSWVINTTLQHSGLNSVHNPIDINGNNTLYMLGTFDFTAKADVMLTFWQIAKTERNYEHCYVEISTDGGATYDQLPESTYEGAGWYREGTGNNYEGPAFYEDSYPEWGTSSEVPDNSWWEKEYFNLTDYNTFDNVVIRFRVVTDTYVNRAGWFIDDIAVEALGAPAFYADPLAITEDVTPVMPASTDLTMGNSGGLPTTFTATVVYDEVDLHSENFDSGIPGTWTIVNNGNNTVTWAEGTSAYNGYDFDGTSFALCDGYQSYVAGSVTMDDELITPPIDASGYIGGALQLEFDQAFDADWNPGDTARVYVYDGASWIMIYESWVDDGFISWSGNGIHKVYDVSAYANLNFQVKFHYIETSLTSRGQYFAIDNFRLRASMFPLGWLTLDGAEYTDGTAMPDADMLPSIINVDMNGSGLAVGTYLADIEVASADPVFTTTLIPVTMNVIAGATISGDLTYANIPFVNTPLDTCTVELYNDAAELLFSTSTDAAGHFEFTGMLDGNYTLETSSTIDWGGLSMNDVQFARQYVTNDPPGNALTGLHLEAGDVDTDGFVLMNDVQAMRQEFTSQPPGFTHFWIFETQNVTVGGGNVTNDYQGVCAGDTDGSYVPPAK